MGQSGILTFSVNKNKIIVFISHGEYTTDLQIYWNLHNLGSKKLYFFLNKFSFVESRRHERLRHLSNKIETRTCQVDKTAAFRQLFKVKK